MSIARGIRLSLPADWLGIGEQNDFVTLGLPCLAAVATTGDIVLIQTPAEAIVAFLSFANRSEGAVLALEKLTQRQWQRVQLWLDDCGLAFYFLQQLKNTNSTAITPPFVLSRLERNFALNQARVDAMSLRFNEINERFYDAGVRYEVVKGFSLVPEFCPYASLRYQGDFDYLIEDVSLPDAKRVLTDLGYNSRLSQSAKESIFVSAGAKPSRGAEQYSPEAAHAVELHTDIWDNEMQGLQPIPNLFSVDQCKIRHWNGVSFPAQADEDAFLLQVLHACHHLFTQWIRVSNLLEIAYFLYRRWSDTDLWHRIEQRVGESAIVREFVVIVVELATRLFAAPSPRLVQDWRTHLRRESQVWIEHYGRDWALCELPAYGLSFFPRSRLVLFLQQQYRSASTSSEAKPQDSSASPRLSRVIFTLKRQPWLLLSREWRQSNLLVRRSVYYVLARARYICEIPRWRWLTRTSASPASGYFLPSKDNS